MTEDIETWRLKNRILSCKEAIKKMAERRDKIKEKNEQLYRLFGQSRKECYTEDIEENEELLGLFGESIDLIMLYKKVIEDKLEELNPKKMKLKLCQTNIIQQEQLESK